MNWFINIPTKQKLILGFGLMFCCLIVTLIITCASIINMRISQENLFEKDRSIPLELMTYRNNANIMRIAVLMITLIDDPSVHAKALKDIKETSKENIAILNDLLVKLKHDPKRLAQVQELYITTQQFMDCRDNKLLPLAFAGKINDAKHLALGVQQKRFQKMRDISTKIGDEVLATSLIEIEEAEANADKSLAIFCLISIAAMAGSILLIHVLNCLICDPLLQITRAAKHVSEGNLKAISLPESSRKDEIGILTNTFNTMVRSLQQLAAIADQPTLGGIFNDPRSDNDILGNAFCAMRRRQELILEAANDSFVQFDECDVIIYWNEQASRTFGWSKKEALGKKLTEVLIPPKFQNSYRKELKQLLDPDKDTAFNKRMEAIAWNKDQQELPIELTLFPMQTESSCKYCLFIRDITERKETERRVSEFYSIVSHELRSPLTSIRGVLGLIAGNIVEMGTNEAKELVEIARGSTDRLIRLINDMLDLKKIEAGKMELHKTKIEIEELVDGTLDSLHAMAAESDIELISNIRSNESIFADRDKTTQVLTNLVSNAIKFAPQGSQVTILTRSGTDNRLRFCVVDNGPGIPAQDKSRLFDKFQQLDSSNTRTKGGSGLGLAISKALIEEHGGTIGVENTPGQGSTFWFELPIYVENPHLVNLNTCTKDNRCKILLIEDDDSVSAVLKVFVENQGYEVICAASLAQAKTCLEGIIPNVIVLDINLPDGNGLDFIETLRASRDTIDVPIIVITGESRTKQALGNATIVDWLFKPLDTHRLSLAIKRAISLPGSCKVLIVDDDSDVRKVLTAQLQSKGLRCIQAKDGYEAIHLTRSEAPDLIVLDVVMPDLDGFKVVEVLSKERSKTTPLIIYTGKDLSSQERQLLSLGVTRYLTKIADSQQDLSEVVSQLLDGLHSPTDSKTIDDTLTFIESKSASSQTEPSANFIL